MDGRGKGVRVRGNSLLIDFTYRGERCRETLKLEPTKANLKYGSGLKAAIEHEIALGTFNYSKYFPDSPRARRTNLAINKTVGQALDEYIEASRRTCELSTWKNYRSAVEHHLRPAFGDLLLRELTTGHIKAWIGTLKISNKRINNVLIPLRSIVGDAFSDEIIDRNPLARISNLAVRFDEPYPFTPDEVAKILQELPPQGKNLIQFAIWTGLRTSELIALEWGDIDWDKKLVRVTCSPPAVPM